MTYLVNEYDVRMAASESLEIQKVMDYITANKNDLGIDDELHLSDNYLQVPRFNGDQMLGIKLEYGFPRNHKVLEISSEAMYDEDGYGYLIPCEDFSDLTNALLEEFETDIH